MELNVGNTTRIICLKNRCGILGQTCYPDFLYISSVTLPKLWTSLYAHQELITHDVRHFPTTVFFFKYIFPI